MLITCLVELLRRFRIELSLAGLASYPTLFLYALFPGQAEWNLAPLPILISIAAALFCFLGATAIWKSRPAAHVLTFVVLLFFFTYGHAANQLGLLVLGGGMGNGFNLIFVNPALFSVWIVALLLLGRWIVKHRHSLAIQRFDQILPVTTVTLLALCAISLLSQASFQDPKKADTLTENLGTAPSKLGYDPDIYFIVMDGYGRSDILKKYFDFDNSDFTSGLSERGFQVLSDSFSSYPSTHTSLTSTLNMILLDEMGKAIGSKRKSRGHIYEYLRNNRLSRLLKQRGYRYIHLASTGGETMVNPYANKLYSCQRSQFKHEIYRVLAEGSMLRVLFENIGRDLAECHLENFETLKSIPSKEPSPKFVFAHIVSPHHPYLFNKSGEILKRATLSNQRKLEKRAWQNKAAYIEQMQFLNEQMLNILDVIVRSSNKPPIIALVSDHGPNYPFDEVRKLHQQSVRQANFIGLHYPGSIQLLPNDLRLVNLFPLILNDLFSANIATQDPKTFYPHRGQFSFKSFEPEFPDAVADRN